MKNYAVLSLIFRVAVLAAEAVPVAAFDFDKPPPNERRLVETYPSSKVTFLSSGRPLTVRAFPKLFIGLLLFILPMRIIHTSSKMPPTISRGRIKS